MGVCCSSDADRTALLLSLDDGSVVRTALSKLSLFDGDKSTNFKLDFAAKAGPLCSFGVNRSPAGLKPLTPADAKAAEKAMRRHELFHGGVQCLFAAWCTLNGGKAVVVVLTSLGRLFAVGGKGTSTIHATQLSSAKLISDEGQLRLTLTGGGQWDLATSPAAAAQLQQMLWVCHSLAEGHLSLNHNMSRMPMHLLPPLSEADGNLHAAYTMHANAIGVAEPENVLVSSDGVTTALQCIRAWAAEAEVSA
jgi:hypothetical protein